METFPIHPAISLWDRFKQTCYQNFDRISSIAHFLFEEGGAVFCHVIPKKIKWTWRQYVSRTITSINLIFSQNGIKRTATLHIHGEPKIKSNKKTTPLLFCHRDHSHPSTLLHLSALAESELPTFSLSIPNVHQNEHLPIYDHLLKQAIDKIEEFTLSKGGIFDGIFGTGHSKGF
jgi:hypothetical protein